jgi:type II secretory pathway component PulC
MRLLTAPRAAAAAAAIAIVGQLSWVGVSWVRQPRPQSAAEAAALALGAGAPAVDFAAVGTLFGQHSVGPIAASEASGDLELTGTIARPDPIKGFGIIRRRGQPDLIYSVGAPLPGGSRLAEVYAKCVVLDGGTSRSTLCLPQARPDGVLAQLAMVSAEPKPDSAVAASPHVPTTAEERRVHPINVPSTPVTDALNPRPLVVDEHLVGYSVSSEADTSPIPGLPRMALIREINGVQLTDGKIAARMFSSLASAGQATFVIQTAGGERTVTLDVSELAALNAEKNRHD